MEDPPNSASSSSSSLHTNRPSSGHAVSPFLNGGFQRTTTDTESLGGTTIIDLAHNVFHSAAAAADPLLVSPPSSSLSPPSSPSIPLMTTDGSSLTTTTTTSVAAVRTMQQQHQQQQHQQQHHPSDLTSPYPASSADDSSPSVPPPDTPRPRLFVRHASRCESRFASGGGRLKNMDHSSNRRSSDSIAAELLSFVQTESPVGGGGDTTTSRRQGFDMADDYYDRRPRRARGLLPHHQDGAHDYYDNNAADDHYYDNYGGGGDDYDDKGKHDDDQKDEQDEQDEEFPMGLCRSPSQACYSVMDVMSGIRWGWIWQKEWGGDQWERRTKKNTTTSYQCHRDAQTSSSAAGGVEQELENKKSHKLQDQDQHQINTKTQHQHFPQTHLMTTTTTTTTTHPPPPSQYFSSPVDDGGESRDSSKWGKGCSQNKTQSKDNLRLSRDQILNDPPIYKKDRLRGGLVRSIITEIICGLIVGFAQVPESVAFAFMAKVYPSVGLHAAWMLGLFATALGGRPGMINGATGTFATVIGGFVEKECHGDGSTCEYKGIETLFISVVLSSLLMFAFAFFRLSYLVQLIPSSVIIGFCNGLAVVIFKSQFHVFREPGEPHSWYTGWVAAQMALICVVAILFMELWPYIPKIGGYIPSTLVAMVASVILEFAILRPSTGRATPTIQEVAAFTRQDATPMPFFLDRDRYDAAKIDWGWTLWKQGVILFLVAVMESLMTVEVVNDLNNNRGNPHQQVFGMAVGNLISGLLGGMGGNSMIGLSVLNFKSGGKSKESGVVASVCVLVMIVGGYRALNYFPVAALAGIMFVVCYHTFKWYSIPLVIVSFMPMRLRSKYLLLQRKISRWDAIIIVVVSVLTAVTNLAIAVVVGVFIAAAFFAWQSMTSFTVHPVYDDKTDTKYYEISGSLFFAAKMKFESCFTPEQDPPKVVVMVKGGDRLLMDYSCLETLNALKKTYLKLEKTLVLQGLSPSCVKMCLKANRMMHFVDEEVQEIQIPDVPKPYLKEGGDLRSKSLWAEGDDSRGGTSERRRRRSRVISADNAASTGRVIGRKQEKREEVDDLEHQCFSPIARPQ